MTFCVWLREWKNVLRGGAVGLRMLLWCLQECLSGGWWPRAVCLKGVPGGGACVGWMMLLVAFVRVSLGFCSYGFAVLMVLELLPFLALEVLLLHIYNGVGVRLRSFWRSCSLLGAGFLAKNELF